MDLLLREYLPISVESPIVLEKEAEDLRSDLLGTLLRVPQPFMALCTITLSRFSPCNATTFYILYIALIDSRFIKANNRLYFYLYLNVRLAI